MTTSNAVTATISSQPATLRMSVVETPPVFATQPLPVAGDTDVSLVPVLRFDVR